VGELSFTGLAAVAAVAFVAPVIVGLVPRLLISAGALELVVGIAIGSSGLGWVEVDDPIRVLSALGLAFLLFLAGLEIDVEHLRGPRLRLAGLSFALSAALAVAIAYALQAGGLLESAPIVALILVASALATVSPLLADFGEADTPFGQLTLAGAAVANVATVILLSLVFTGESTDAGARAILLAGFVALAAVVAVGVCELERSVRLSAVLVRLQDTSAQVRVRGAFLLLAACVALAGRFGVEVVLAAFTGGVLVALVDRDATRTHPQFRVKLEGAGYGFFIPVFMVAAGLRFDLDALVASASSLALAPIFLAGLLAVHLLPAALVYPRLVGGRLALVAGLLQSISLAFIVAASEIGMELGLVARGTGAALIAAGLLSVVILPPLARGLLRREGTAGAGMLAPIG
jgi:Kef-type K+ transport system membrane component KefB